MSNQEKPMTQKLYDNAPTTRQAVKFVTAAGIGLTLLFLSGITLTGTVLSVILATPILVLFSPILVPAGIALFLATAGLLFSGGCGVAAVTALSWIYNYLAGKHPIGSDRLDYARERIADKARDVKERAKAGYGGQYAQDKGSEVAA